MNEKVEIEACIGPRIARILTFAEAAMDERQFRLFRKMVFNELGRNGLASELAQLRRSEASSRSRQG